MRPRNLFPVDTKSLTNGSTAPTTRGYDTTGSGFFKTTSKPLFTTYKDDTSALEQNASTAANSTSSPSILATQSRGMMFKLQTPRPAWPQVPPTQALDYNVGQIDWGSKGVIDFQKVRGREQFGDAAKLPTKSKRTYFPRSESEGAKERKTLDFERMLGRNTRVFGRMEGNPVEMGMMEDQDTIPSLKREPKEQIMYQRRDYFHVLPAEDIFSENLKLIS